MLATAVATFGALLPAFSAYPPFAPDATATVGLAGLLVLVGLLRPSWAVRTVVLAAAVVVVVWSLVPTLSRIDHFPESAGLTAASVWSLFPAMSRTGHTAAWVFAVLGGVPVLLAWRSPLLAWRVVAVLGLTTPLIVPRFPWDGVPPWSPGLIATAVAVVFLVSLRHGLSVQVWVWLLSVAIVHAWAYWPVRTPGELLVSVVMLAGNTVRLRRVALASRREQARISAAEGTRRAVLEERARIARELHDVVAHHMTVLALRADSAPYRLPGLSAPVRAEFVELNELAREGLGEMRRLLGVLRAEGEAVDTAPQPGVAQVEELVHRLRAAGTPITTAIHLGRTPLPTAVGLTTYRIVQEALSNAVKHAPGATVHVELRVHRGELLIRVRNGPPTQPPAPAAPGQDRPGHGLIGMRERVSMLGGTLGTGGPTPEGGFTVQASLPLAVPAQFDAEPVDSGSEGG
ncbi:sensor histidine kinase [Goodfellowiella coeruleoviolacea]|uniref:histidine kinase n=1 Tax=Goodfellowiella coeruleoviolacea TaxID=334858 RepID=A0AAE3G8S3_9PSEU|nr:histidine kinase [Goodfellowiella coeruleoviolacea]MCP2163801.1 Signal transduction histidine kinase [Goodfellowiella coeruleoviolacea]